MYQVEGIYAVSELGMRQLKDKISGIEPIDEPGSKSDYAQEVDGIWAYIFETVYENKFVTDAFIWQDQIVKQAIYHEAVASEDGIPSVEDIMNIRCLQIEDADQAVDFQDLTMLSNLRELYILRSGLTDISFVKNFLNWNKYLFWK